MSRVRIVDSGRQVLTGRAWSGTAPIARVEVSIDSGAHWDDAVLGDRRAAGRGVRGRSTGRPVARTRRELCCRATDELGNVQPLDQSWNRQGMANNMIHRVPVVVR